MSQFLTVMLYVTMLRVTIYYFYAERHYAEYCIEGTEMRQLGFKVRRLLFLNRY
jgi:hypothetical protein